MPDILQKEIPVPIEEKQNASQEQAPIALRTPGPSVGRKQRLEAFDSIKLAEARKKLGDPQSAKGLIEEEKIELQRRIDQAELLESIGGVDFSRCDFALIWKNYLEGDILEFDTFSPYLSDHNQGDGSFTGLTRTEEIGLTVGRYLKSIFPKSRTVALYDDYNNSFPDSTDIYGRPTKSGAMLAFSEKAKANFLVNVRRKLQQYKLIGKNEREGQDYYLVSESSKIQEAERFVGLLEEKGLIKRKGREIVFVNSNSEHPFYQKILLRDSQGKWRCEALDATSFLDPVNATRTHLVILPRSFAAQQDKVWEMLRMINISPDNYHNIFYDEKLSPEEVLLKIKQKLEEGKRQLVAEKAA